MAEIHNATKETEVERRSGPMAIVLVSLGIASGLVMGFGAVLCYQAKIMNVSNTPGLLIILTGVITSIVALNMAFSLDMSVRR